MALIAAIGIVGYSFTQGRRETPTKSALPVAARPLSKPEPESLLSNSRLALSPGQEERIRAVDAGWKREKARLLAGMDHAHPTQGRIDQIQSSLADYSALSRHYEATRSRYWHQALNALDAEQRKQVTK